MTRKGRLTDQSSSKVLSIGRNIFTKKLMRTTREFRLPIFSAMIYTLKALKIRLILTNPISPIFRMSGCVKNAIVVYQLASSFHHFKPDIRVRCCQPPPLSLFFLRPPCSHISPSPDVILQREGGENVRWVSLNHCVLEVGLIVWVLKMTKTRSPLLLLFFCGS